MRTVKSYRYYAYFTIRNVHLKQLSTEKLVERDLKSSTRETHARKHNAIREHTTRSPLGPPARTYACNDHDVPYVQRTRYYIVNNDIVYSRVCTYTSNVQTIKSRMWRVRCATYVYRGRVVIYTTYVRKITEY